MSANAVPPGDGGQLDLVLSVDVTGQVALDLGQPPAEDAGAATSANYHYQTEIIASFCLCMPTDGTLTSIICEWHEDFILVRSDDSKPLELVSVKHRERDDYTTLGKLCDAGGLAHLFDRWLGFSSAPRARLCSNGRLSGKPSEPTPRALEQICNSRNLKTPEATAIVSHLAWAMMDIVKNLEQDDDTFSNIPRPAVKPLPRKAERATSTGLPDGLFEALIRFLLLLRFDCGRPDKVHISDINIRQLAEPAMANLGLSKATAPAAYAGVLGLVAEACRDRSGRPRDLAAFLADPDAEAGDSPIRATLDRRTITRDQLMAVMAAGAAASDHQVPLLRTGEVPARAAGGHQLLAKMADADIAPEERDNALELRDLWLHAWPQLRTGFPEDVEYEFRLRLEILEIVRHVRHQLAEISDPFGPKFQVELHKAIRAAGLGSKCGIPLDDFHVLGLTYELSDLCRISFTRTGRAA